MSHLYRVSPPSAVVFRDEGDAGIVEGPVVPYGQWSEVDSVVEGHFMERFASRSLRKSFSEAFTRMKGYFEHGRSRMFDRTPVMDIIRAWDDDAQAMISAELLRGLPPWMMDGLRRGLYGFSIGAEPLKVDRVRNPKPSAHNPHGIEERTYKELRVFDVSLTPSPHYETATATLRSITDDLAIEQFLSDDAAKEKLLGILRKATEAEPTHSEPTDEVQEVPEPATDPEQVEPEPDPEEKPDDPEPEPEPEPEGSRATQPPHDYLSDESEEEWRL